MAKYEKTFTGNFEQVLNVIHQGILEGSVSASYEDGSDYEKNGLRCAVRVYERYSSLGSNRVSLNVTLVGTAQEEGEQQLFLSAITSGGSQAIWFKLNVLGEESFLECLKEIIQKLEE